MSSRSAANMLQGEEQVLEVVDKHTTVSEEMQRCLE